MKNTRTIMVHVRDLCKIFTTKSRGFEKKVEAVRSINLDVYAGEIFGLLGPNGAGKTTTMRMLCTLLKPTSGSVTIAGFDLTTQQNKIREVIGYVGQKGGMEQLETGRENLLFQARLYGLGAQEAAQRADQVIKELDLADYADRKVSSYSGGQRRMFDVAASILHKPKLLFLDEPSTGLDPHNRLHIWQVVKRLRDEGTTIFVTTHYLEEADELCDRVAIVDHGQLVALDKPVVLKGRIAGDSLVFDFAHEQEAQQVARLIKQQPFVKEVLVQETTISVYAQYGDQALPECIKLLHQHNVVIKTVRLTRPTLDDVFLKLTGRSLQAQEGV